MSSPGIAPLPNDTPPSDPPVAPGRRSRPVLSPARTRPRTGRGPIAFSLLVHLVVLSVLVVFLRLGSPLRPIAGGESGPGEQVEYFDLVFPGAGTPSGIPAAPAPAATPGTTPATTPSAPSTSDAPARPRRPQEEPIVFPRAPATGVPAPAPAAGGAGQGGGAGEAGAAGQGPGGQGPGGQAGGGGIGDRLQPGYRDPRLYVDQQVEQLKETDTRSDIQKYRERLRAAIEASNDSAWAQGSHPNTDWTTRDKNGRKWGVDEKGVYLGGVRIPKAIIPTPRATGTNQQLEAERQKETARQEIQRQEEARDRKKAQDESIKETRARKDAERKEQSGGGS